MRIWLSQRAARERLQHMIWWDEIGWRISFFRGRPVVVTEVLTYSEASVA